MKTKDLMEELEESVTAYNHAFRWKNYKEAAMFRPPEQRAMFVAKYTDDKESLQVEDLQIIQVHMVTEKHVQAVVRVRYMMLPSTTIQKRTIVQDWFRVKKEWRLEEESDPILKIGEIGMELPPPAEPPEAVDDGPADDPSPVDPDDIQ